MSNACPFEYLKSRFNIEMARSRFSHEFTMLSEV
jgi:hypothetical protein